MLTRGLLGYLPANIIQAVVAILTIWVFTNLLTPSQYGAYALAFSVFTLVHSLAFSWIEAGMARYWAAQKTSQDLADLYTSLYQTLLRLTLLLAPVCIVIVYVVPLPAILHWPIIIALIAIPLRCALNMIRVAFSARGDVRSASNVNTLSIVGAFALGTLAIGLGAGASGPMLGILIIPVIILPMFLPVELRHAKGGHAHAEYVRTAFKYGYPISLALGMSIILNATDRFMIAYYMNEAAVGAYHASYSLANRTLDIVFVWLGAAGVPAMVMALEKHGPEELKSVAVQLGRTMILITLPAAIGIALVAQPLAAVMIGPELRDGAARVTPLIAASAFLSGMLYYYFNQAFSLGKQTWLLLLTMVIPAIANIAFNAVLIPRFGLMGAAVSTVLSFTMAVVASVVIGKRVLVMPMPAKALLQCLLCCVPMVLAVLAIPDMGGFVELICKATVGACIYGVAAYAINAAGVRELIKMIIAERAAQS